MLQSIDRWSQCSVARSASTCSSCSRFPRVFHTHTLSVDSVSLPSPQSMRQPVRCDGEHQPRSTVCRHQPLQANLLKLYSYIASRGDLLFGNGRRTRIPHLLCEPHRAHPAPRSKQRLEMVDLNLAAFSLPSCSHPDDTSLSAVFIEHAALTPAGKLAGLPSKRLLWRTTRRTPAAVYCNTQCIRRRAR